MRAALSLPLLIGAAVLTAGALALRLAGLGSGSTRQPAAFPGRPAAGQTSRGSRSLPFVSDKPLPQRLRERGF